MALPDNKNIANRNAVVFGGVALVWLLLDYLTKKWADAASVGDILWPGIPGVFDFRLVHNTGAAWGILDGSTFALGLFAVVFSACLLLAAHLRRSRASVWEMVGFGLVLAGGIGNAIDRFLYGYVVDFIDAACINFPVFNIADIGVTCGFALIILFYLLSERSSEHTLENTED